MRLKKLNRNQKGLTLIEVLIAIAILGMIAVPFLTALSTSSRGIIIADERTTAESLARAQLEDVKNQGYNNSTAPEASYDIIEVPDEIGNYLIKGLKKDGYVGEGDSLQIVVNETTVNPDNIVGVAWNATAHKTTTEETGIQIVTVVIYHGAKLVLTTSTYKVDR